MPLLFLSLSRYGPRSCQSHTHCAAVDAELPEGPQYTHLLIYLFLETGAEGRVVLRNSCEGHGLPILILLEQKERIPQRAEHRSLPLLTAFRVEKTQMHESRKLPARVTPFRPFPAPFFCSSRKVAKNKAAAGFCGAAARQPNSPPSSTRNLFLSPELLHLN